MKCDGPLRTSQFLFCDLVAFYVTVRYEGKTELKVCIDPVLSDRMCALYNRVRAPPLGLSSGSALMAATDQATEIRKSHAELKT